MKTLRSYKRMLLGYVDGESIYLSAPSWDCGWYWGFGYLGNRNCHYHVDGLKKVETYNHKLGGRTVENFNLHDGFLKHFGDTLRVKPSDLWKLAELFETFYTLKKTAEVLGRGGSHLTTNPLSELIKNSSEVERINREVLPAIFDEIFKILEAFEPYKKAVDKLIKIDLKGDTGKSLNHMLETGLTPDDIKGKVSNDDFSRLHSVWWKHYHANKNK